MQRWALTPFIPPAPHRLRLLLVSLVVLIALWNIVELARLAAWWLDGSPHTDWANLSQLEIGRPYATDAFRWSPPAAWLWVTAIDPLGLTVWRLVHIAALLLLPLPIAGLMVLSAPFWADVINGNVLTFAFVAAWRALAGSQAATISFVALAVLVPRPLMLPVLIWLLWYRSFARWAFVAIAVAVLGVALLDAQLMPWVARLVAMSGPETASPWNIGPSHFIGVAWIPIGVALAGLLVWRGHLGLASLAASPYLFHYYLLFGLLELRAPPADQAAS